MLSKFAHAICQKVTQYKFSKWIVSGLVIIPTSYFLTKGLTAEYLSKDHTNSYLFFTSYLGNIIALNVFFRIFIIF